MNTVHKNLILAVICSLVAHILLIFFCAAPPVLISDKGKSKEFPAKTIIINRLNTEPPSKKTTEDSHKIKTDSGRERQEQINKKLESSIQLKNNSFSDKELSKRPHPRSHIDLELPEFDGKELSGKLSAYVIINEQGKVIKIEKISDTLPQKASDKIIAKYSSALFFPGEINGKAVTSKTKISIYVKSEEFRNASDNITRFESIK